MARKLKKYQMVLLCIAVFFLLFALITRWTPLCGDDWVYAVGGRQYNPFARALHMYQTWSGRYLSELWGFVVAPHKRLWNLLNPLLFTGIYVLLIVLSAGKKYHNLLLSALLGFLLITTAANHMRMQTYTWIMGDTYVVPLLLFLIYLLLLKDFVWNKKHTKLRLFFMALLSFAIPLYMENAAALICGCDLLVLISLFMQKRNRDIPSFLIPFACAVCGTLIILLSPGAHQRLTGDNAAFNALSLMGKLAMNWDNFILHTYSEHVWLWWILSILFACFTFQNRQHCHTRHGWMIICAVFILAPVSRNQWMYLAETACAFYVFAVLEENYETKYTMIFLLLCALGANLVMLVSPIFDTRSAIYTFFLLILLSMHLMEELTIPQKEQTAAAVLLACLCIYRSYDYYSMYHLVHAIDAKRSQQIAYYQKRPGSDAWLIAYPDELIHSPNVLEGDSVHDTYFKEYYYLDPDTTLNFYYLQEYTVEAVQNS